MANRVTTHRRHPAYDRRPMHPGARSSAFAGQLIIASMSFAVIVGAAVYALEIALGR